ncbi:MAG: ABC transporter ATP-binding protein [Boseongicola sp.]|nr:ABC transporter ATP-binding protein [Boseongicola sp.]NNL17327.1 ABC transporter ATP-binding protein [Boseongicola sp.]
MVLSVNSVNKRFGDVSILKDVSLTLAAGEVLALTGESGSGKSTLLHMIAGLEPIDSGEISIDGNDLGEISDSENAALRRRKIGIIFQQFNLIPSLTVAQNLTFQARLSGVGTDLPSLAASLGLAEHLSKYPEQLSGGQQQRVAIGRAVAAAPKLILADEPTGNLDEQSGDQVFDLLLSSARDQQTALLIVTHSNRLAARADRQLHLSRGEVQ